MRARFRPSGGWLWCALAAILSGCAGGGDAWTELSPRGEPTDAMRIIGVIEHLEVEGGVWVIRADDGTAYNPINLPEAFRRAGLQVEADAAPAEDVMSIGMVGPMIELARIRERSGG